MGALLVVAIWLLGDDWSKTMIEKRKTANSKDHSPRVEFEMRINHRVHKSNADDQLFCNDTYVILAIVQN